VYKSIIKPIIDFIASLCGVIIISPLLIVILLTLFILNSGKPFFIQTRTGKNGKLFKVIKFKTMTDRKDSHGNLLPDDKRLTTYGSFIRKTSLDEIPQLLNVLKGDMSLVGPRPLLVEYLPLYSEIQARRHEVKPGITGWAQINGRNAISWEEKFKLDVWYVDNISFRLDCKILFNTFFRVLKPSGISSGTSATMEHFTGN
jgi:lipopolysaccharide/colanic/teichoic acid biosynthesis glycosyltransferase